MDNGRCPHEFIFDMNGTGYMDGIQSAALQVCCDCRTVMDVKTARNLICTVDSCEDRDLALCCFLDLLNDQAGETHTVFKASAELVYSLVCSWRKECTYQITVCHVDLYSICAGFHGSSCCLSVSFDQLINFFRCKLFRNVTATY